MLQIYNTLTRQKERFKPKNIEHVKVYFCGPTVYNYAHIGNLRAYIFEDLVIKTLRFLGYKVEVLMNLTDIDDKTIRDSQKAGESLKDFTEKYSKIFLNDIEKIGINKADKIVPISDLIDEMVDMTNTLIKKGYAYIGEDQSIYYDIKKFKDYGKLAHLDFSGMKSSVRIDNDEYDKENAADFVLWKAWKPEDGENYREKEFVVIDYETNLSSGANAKDPFSNVNSKKHHLRDSSLHSEGQSATVKGQSGLKNLLNDSGTGPEGQSAKIEGNSGGQKEKDNLIDPRVKHEDDNVVTIKGRPGWHIECSACNLAHFGPEIDIHMGGVDLIFPHHQNEIAQSEAVTGKKFSRYWIHSGHLMVDGKKMSKSLGNFYTLKDIEEKYEGKVSKSVMYRSFRLGFINGKYRDNIDFSFTKLEQNFNTIDRIDETIKKLYLTKKTIKSEKDTTSQKAGVLKVKGIRRDFRDSMQKFVTDYVEKLEDDFDFVEALAVFFNYLTFVNKELKNLSLEEYNAVIDMFKTFNEVLGIIDFTDSTEIEIPANILEKIEQRNTAKKEKNFMLADALRDEIDALGYKIVDSREGSRVERK